MSSSFVESGAGTGWVRHLIIKNFECKYFTSVLSYKKKKVKSKLKNNREKRSLLIVNPTSSLNPLNFSLQIWDTELNRSFYKERFLLKVERNIINLTKYNRSVIIGIVLSDGFIEKRIGWNPRIRFEYSIKSFEYIWFIFNQLGILINGYPLLLKRILRNKIFYTLAFKTRQLECLNEIYNLFYIFPKVKIIKPELYDYFNSIVLAHWIMGNGSKAGKGIIICTDSCSIEEVVLLMNILKIKYNVDSTIHYHTSYAPLDILKLKMKKSPRIYINEINLGKIKPLIQPYILNCFLYKI